MKSSAPKTKKSISRTENSVDEYIASVPPKSRAAFLKLREIVRSTVPSEANEVISYRVPGLKLGRMLVWYAAFKNHVSLFPTASVIEEFRDELKDYSISKGTVQFPVDAEIPTQLIQKLVRARLKPNVSTAGPSKRRA